MSFNCDWSGKMNKIEIKIKKAISDILNELYELNQDDNIIVEIPKDHSHGD